MKVRSRLLMVSTLLIALFTAVPGYGGGKEPSVTYYRDVLPIIQENCQGCHRPSGQNLSGLVAPMSFMDYRETRPWARAIAQAVEAREMPPWFASAPKGIFSNERGLTDDEIDTVVSWVEAGAPAGILSDSPPGRQWIEAKDGWPQGTPDLVLKSPLYRVEDDVYDQNVSFYVTVPEVDLPEDVWLQGAEFRIGDNTVTHHMCVWVYPSGGPVRADGSVVEDEGAAAVDLEGSTRLNCTAAGGESGMLPDGYGVLLEKGATIGFHLHYYKQPGPGTASMTQATVGFYLSKEPPQYTVVNEEIFNRGFEIPPNHAKYRIGSSRVFEHETHLLSLWPHSHKRGTAVRFAAIYPDGTEELLLDVPNYEDGWQVTYKYKEPKVIPKGTRIDVDFWYNNSPERAVRRDFNPSQSVGHGPKTNDEMSLGFIGFAEVKATSEASRGNE